MSEPRGAAPSEVMWKDREGHSRRGRARPTAESPITVLIADDQQMVRRGFRVILEAEPDIRVVAEAGDGREAVELVRRHAPAVALLDIRMPVLDGLRAARQVIALSPGTRVLIFTTFDADEYVYEALRAGASGFLLKDAPADQLITAVRSLAAGDALHRPGDHPQADLAVRAGRPRAGRPARGAAPAHRARAGGAAAGGAGLSNVEVARELVVEENTVKTHVSRILMKLGLRDRVQAVVLAYESAS